MCQKEANLTRKLYVIEKINITVRKSVKLYFREIDVEYHTVQPSNNQTLLPLAGAQKEELETVTCLSNAAI